MGRGSNDKLVWIDADPNKRSDAANQVVEEQGQMLRAHGLEVDGPVEVSIAPQAPLGSKPPFQSLLPTTQPDFDSAWFESLHLRDYSVATIIEDDDPNPNDIRKMQVRAGSQSWVAELNDLGEWTINDVPGGPNLQRACNFAKAFDSQQDLTKFQGPDAVA